MTMTNQEALEAAYAALSPYADKQRWEFYNNVVHLHYLTQWLPANAAILDVGCGIGILALALHYLGYTVTGGDKYVFLPDNDFNVADIDALQAMWRREGITITPYDAVHDPVVRRYDAVISIATIEHQWEPRVFIERLAANVTDGGLLYLATPNVAHGLNRVRFVFGRSPLQHNLIPFALKGLAYEGHIREYTLAELRQLVTVSGLDVIASKHVQSMRPRLRLWRLRSWYVGAFRLIARLWPSWGDTLIIMARRPRP